MNLRLAKLLAMAMPIFILAGCNSDKSKAEAAVKADLSDPDSAKFGDYYYNEKTKNACLVVTSKNQEDGFTGNHAVLLSKTDKGFITGLPLAMDMNFCKKLAD